MLALASATSYMIKMRDGVSLHTDIDLPLGYKAGEKVACLMDRSPYGDSAIELLAEIGLLDNHTAVRQDVRGTKQSEGLFSLWHSSASDTYDTVEWLTNQSWSNGIVYMIGASADGLEDFSIIAEPHPAVHAQFAVFAGTSGYDMVFPGGAVREALVEGWLRSTVPNNYTALIAETYSHEVPDNWWDILNGTKFFKDVDWPSAMWAGWYDIFLVGQVDAFNGFNSMSQVDHEHTLVIDPLGHCQAAAKYFNNTLVGRAILPLFQLLELIAKQDVTPPDLRRNAIEKLRAKYWPRDIEGFPTGPENAKNITFYVMGASSAIDPGARGAPGSYWTTLETWPSFTPTRYYLASGNALTTTVPTGASTSTSYVYDPKYPVPTIGGNNLELPCGPLDQSPLESGQRSDVLVFSSAPLQAPVAVTGKLQMELWVSSNCTDTDFTVKLTDVYPNGYSALIQDGIVRMRWRNRAQSSVPQPMVPGTVYPVVVDLWYTSFIWAVGHRIRVDVSSSNSKRFSVNPNTGAPLSPDPNVPTLIALNTVHYGGAATPSAFVLPVIADPTTQLPPFAITMPHEPEPVVTVLSDIA